MAQSRSIARLAPATGRNAKLAVNERSPHHISPHPRRITPLMLSRTWRAAYASAGLRTLATSTAVEKVAIIGSGNW